MDGLVQVVHVAGQLEDVASAVVVTDGRDCRRSVQVGRRSGKIIYRFSVARVSQQIY